MFWLPAAGAGGALRLLDGDKIAALAALLVCDLLAALPAGARGAMVRSLARKGRVGSSYTLYPLWGLLDPVVLVRDLPAALPADARALAVRSPASRHCWSALRALCAPADQAVQATLSGATLLLMLFRP